MTTHNTPRVKLKPFIFLTVLQAVHKNVFVLSSDEYINPVDGGIGYEVKFLLILEFVIAAHVGS